MTEPRCVLFHDNFQNFKSYNIPKAQLVIADIPYNIGSDFYASRPDWYVDGDNRNGESDKARKAAFNTDFTFNIAEYFHFCNRLLKKEPMKGEKGAPCMIVFCAFQQIPKVITEAEKYGFKNYIPLTFCTLSQILQTTVLQKYYLSPKACLGMRTALHGASTILATIVFWGMTVKTAC